jgi:nucleoside-diphosphate-sugar epimerase
MRVDRRLPVRVEPQTVLITGSSGLLGSAIAVAIEAAGWTVRGADRMPGQWTTVIGDLRESSVRRAAGDAHAVWLFEQMQVRSAAGPVEGS